MTSHDPVTSRTTRRLPGGITIIRDRTHREVADHLPVVLGLVGLLAVLIHDLAYRQTGGSDFEIYGVVSHAGADMLALTAALVITAAIAQRTR